MCVGDGRENDVEVAAPAGLRRRLRDVGPVVQVAEEKAVVELLSHVEVRVALTPHHWPQHRIPSANQHSIRTATKSNMARGVGRLVGRCGAEECTRNDPKMMSKLRHQLLPGVEDLRARLVPALQELVALRPQPSTCMCVHQTTVAGGMGRAWASRARMGHAWRGARRSPNQQSARNTRRHAKIVLLALAAKIHCFQFTTLQKARWMTHRCRPCFSRFEATGRAGGRARHPLPRCKMGHRSG